MCIMNDKPDHAAADDGQSLGRALDSLVGCAFLTLDSVGTVTSWSGGAEHLFGHPREQAVGQHWSFIFSPEDHTATANDILTQTEQQVSISTTQCLRRADGSLDVFSLTTSVIRVASRCIGYAALASPLPILPRDDDAYRTRDMLLARLEATSRRLSESNALLASAVAERTIADAARLRLLRRLVVAEEVERRRIARDLHDDLGQRLTSLRLTLEALRPMFMGRLDLSEALSKALRLLQQIDQSLDFLAWDIRPPALDELGLTKVLENYVDEWSKHADVRAVFHAGPRDTERLTPEVESSVYRIAQEALNNVAKHAGAQSVNVLLEQRGADIVLIVEDDGAGFSEREATQRMNGLTGMKERAAAVGGTLELEPTPDGGTTVHAHIPISMSPRAGSQQEFVYGVHPQDQTRATSPPHDVDTRAAVVNSIRARLQELQDAVVSRDEFIATVAHELRNPVAPLMFQVRLAIDKSEQIAGTGEPLPTEWVQSQLRRFEQRLHRLLETLDRLLDVSRLSTGRIDLQLERVNLAATAREVATSFESELAVARCKLLFSEEAEASGLWDRIRLEQICWNLLSNAIRFGAGRPIEISVNADEEFATLQVRDHGVGIAAHLHNRIFERFERGVERRSGGFGIGLWVVKNICAAMGGTVSVKSELGEGACFTVMLPRHRDRELIGETLERP
jgi:PAS domain S-box-containing protein